MTRDRRRHQPQQIVERYSTHGDRLPDHSAPRPIDKEPTTGPITIAPPLNSSAESVRGFMAELAEKISLESIKNHDARESIRTLQGMSESIRDIARELKGSKETAQKAELAANERHQSIGATLSIILSETRSNRADINTLQAENLSVESRVSAIEKKAELEIAESAGADKLLTRQKNIAKLLWSVVVTLFGIASYLAGKLLK